MPRCAKCSITSSPASGGRLRYRLPHSSLAPGDGREAPRLAGPAQPAPGKPEPSTQKRDLLSTFTVPTGFTVELVAGPPLVERPMMASFDERGRLFVCDSSGFNLMQGTSDVMVKNPTNFIRLLEDRDGDGRFDASEVFADKMTFPMGALWHKGSLYSASAPSLQRPRSG